LEYVRSRADGFFPAGRTGDAVLNCYRLARFYSRPPAEFLAMPLDEVAQHIMWTERLLANVEMQRRPQ